MRHYLSPAQDEYLRVIGAMTPASPAPTPPPSRALAGKGLDFGILFTISAAHGASAPEAITSCSTSLFKLVVVVVVIVSLMVASVHVAGAAEPSVRTTATRPQREEDAAGTCRPSQWPLDPTSQLHGVACERATPRVAQSECPFVQVQPTIQVQVDAKDALTEERSCKTRLGGNLGVGAGDRLIEEVRAVRSQVRLLARSHHKETLDMHDQLAGYEQCFATCTALLAVLFLMTGWIVFSCAVMPLIGRRKEGVTLHSDSLVRGGSGVEARQGQGKKSTPLASSAKADHEQYLPPDELLASLISAAESRGASRLPEAPRTPWSIGCHSHCGMVRPENQDYHLGFRIGGHDCLLVADGCGGMPHGQLASMIAVQAAAGAIIGAFEDARSWSTPPVRFVAAKGMQEAACQLSKSAMRMGILDVHGGLRTTLIIVVGSRDEYAFAYVGDGGGVVVRAAGEVDRFLEPQKEPGSLNVLTASLGPELLGEPIIGTLKRLSGDLVLIGSDGIVDRVQCSFPKEVLRCAIQHGGDLTGALVELLDDLASQQDKYGFVCDDNLTLAVLADGVAPRLARGFWNVDPDGVSARKLQALVVPGEAM